MQQQQQHIAASRCHFQQLIETHGSVSAIPPTSYSFMYHTFGLTESATPLDDLLTILGIDSEDDDDETFDDQSVGLAAAGAIAGSNFAGSSFAIPPAIDEILPPSQVGFFFFFCTFDIYFYFCFCIFVSAVADNVSRNNINETKKQKKNKK